MSSDLIEHVRKCTGLSDDQIDQGLAQRSGHQPLGAHILRQWQAGKAPLPAWAERACVQWIVELWTEERDSCTSQGLWPIDKKYSRMLEGFTVADIARLVQKPANRGP